MNSTKYPIYHLTQNEKIALSIINVFSMSMGLFGNIIAVTILNLHQSSFGRPTRIILGSLAVSDILVIIVVQPLYIYSFFHTINTNVIYIAKASRWALLLDSLLHLFIVSFERFLAICTPNLYHKKLKHSHGWCITVIIVVWTFTIVVGTTLTLVVKRTARLIHGMIGLLCFLVMIILVLIHIRLLVVATNQYKKIEREHNVKGYVSPSPTKDEENNHDFHEIKNQKNRLFFYELKAFKTTTIVCGAFLISWLPLIITGFIYMTTQDMDIKETILHIFPYVNTLAFINSAQNPLIYSFKIHSFRAVLRKMFDRIRNRYPINGSIN